MVDHSAPERAVSPMPLLPENESSHEAHEETEGPGPVPSAEVTEESD